MKRGSSGAAADPHHPALAFHREVLIIQQWTSIRRAFLHELESVGATGVVQWREPRKLWRHAQEALGKWILSQVARVHLPPHRPPTAGATSTSTDAAAAAARQLEADIHFFPSADQLRTAMSHADDDGRQPELRTYDAQLVRDLSIKSNGAHDAAAVAALVQLVEHFGMARRCAAAAEAVVAGMSGVTPAQALQPRIRRIDADDPQRTPQQQRIDGPVAEVAVQWPRHWRREQCRDCPPVSLPWAAVQKLRMCYDAVAEAAERTRYDADGATDATRERRFVLRAAAVILRYEGGLATGSLQLCADTRLKQHLHAAGYHVMDLCASPINAYMGQPRPGRFKQDTDVAGAAEVPNSFCSAFYDTDQYFGSLGSAVAVDPRRIHADAAVNPRAAPLLLTLDVPYDEDLCELLFQKLVRDMRGGAAPAVVDYVLVLPLWWDIQMKIDKRLFGRGATATAAPDAPAAVAESVAQVVRERAAVLREGYVVPYGWPAALAEAAGDARGGAADAWVCFDGVFIDDDYTYFCTATNKSLRGVTATEVIGLAQPRPSPQLRTALDAFYGGCSSTSTPV
ncbi:Phosphorylated CTD interacting factor 1 WW domain containing protein [Novymonas esmeraldas]|uniref:Phosphorylated CTD interacting factor 1 WW domain containing protein n=1 Tax=Novymonas esmeraldas TaxID=1808958 RepID=A0AAW0EV95_9TRYP